MGMGGDIPSRKGVRKWGGGNRKNIQALKSMNNRIGEGGVIGVQACLNSIFQFSVLKEFSIPGGWQERRGSIKGRGSKIRLLVVGVGEKGKNSSSSVAKKKKIFLSPRTEVPWRETLGTGFATWWQGTADVGKEVKRGGFYDFRN